MRNHNAQKSIHASFKWYVKEGTGLFLSAKSVVQYFICWYDELIFFILLLFFLLHINVIYFGYVFKIKEIMNVNRRIILVKTIIVMIKSMIMVNYVPFNLITDPDPCERCYLHDCTYLTGFHSGCQEQPLLERYAWNLNMFASLSFVTTICLWKPHTFMWQNLEERDLWLALQKTYFFFFFLLLSQIRWGLHWIVE